MDRPRRQVLTATSSLLTLGIAGCLTNEARESSPDGKSGRSKGVLSAALADPLSMIPASVGDVDTVHAVTPSVFDDISAVPTQVDYRYFAPVDQLSAIDWLVEITPVDSLSVRVVVGDITPDSYSDEQHVRDRNGLALYELDTAGPGVRTAAFADGIMIQSADEQLIKTIVTAAGSENTEPLLAAYPDLESGLAQLEGYDSRRVEPATQQVAESFGVDGDTIRTSGRGQTLPDDDHLERRYYVQLTDESAVTTALEERFESMLKRSDEFIDRPNVNTEGPVLYADTTIDLAARRRDREHDSPVLGSESGYDSDTERLVIPIVRGDETPIEELTLEIDGNPYDPGIWADGRETIESGDEIYVRKADCEPFTGISLVHDGQYGTNEGPKWTGLSHLAFEYEYDSESRSLRITYADEFPLDGAHVYGGVYDDPDWRQRERIIDAVGSKRESGPKPDRTVQAWNGTEITDETTVTIESVDPGDTVAIGWRSVPETSIAAFTVPEPNGAISTPNS